MKILHNDYIHLAVRLIMGVLFIYAGVGKIIDPLGFAASIYNYKLLPDAMVGIAAVVIPWLETVAGTALILGFKSKGGSLAISGLLTLFIFIIVISAVRGLDVECGCFSGVERAVGYLAIFEDSVMLAGALFLLFFDRERLVPYKLIMDRTKKLQRG